MLVYLDNCCFNRPFDNQSSIRVKLETDAKLYVQFLIKSGKLNLAWSYILDFENAANPFFERKYTVDQWKQFSVVDVHEGNEVLIFAKEYVSKGLKPKDALHVACATIAKCDYLLTTDDLIQKKIKGNKQVTIINPIDFIKIIEHL